MTREECKNIAEAISFKIGERQRLSLPGVNELIDQIFNDHEAQLNAKDEEIEVLHFHLKTIDEDYSALASDFESAVMEIDRLKDTK